MIDCQNIPQNYVILHVEKKIRDISTFWPTHCDQQFCILKRSETDLVIFFGWETTGKNESTMKKNNVTASRLKQKMSVHIAGEGEQWEITQS